MSEPGVVDLDDDAADWEEGAEKLALAPDVWGVSEKLISYCIINEIMGLPPTTFLIHLYNGLRRYLGHFKTG